jgi:hypothetical protein
MPTPGDDGALSSVQMNVALGVVGDDVSNPPGV